MSDEVARLKYVIDATDATRAKAEMDKLTAATEKAERAAEKLQTSEAKAGDAISLLGARAAKSEQQLQRLAAFKAQLAGKSKELATATSAAAQVMDSRLTMSAARAMTGLARMGAQSSATGLAVRGMLTGLAGAAGEFAGAFIPGGIVVSAVLFAGQKIVEFFTGARAELRETAEEFAKDVESMRQSADALGLTKKAFGLQQERNPLQARLDSANASNYGGLTVGEALRARRTLPGQIAALDEQIAKIRDAILNPAAQYAPSSLVPPGRVEVDTPEAIARKKREAASRARTQANEQRRQARETEEAAREAREAAMENEFGARAFRQERAIRNLVRNPLQGVGGTGGVADMVYANYARGGEKEESGTMAERVKRAEALFQSFTDGMQRTFANAFVGVFTKGLRSAADFARGMRDLLLNAFAEVASSKVVGALVGGGAGSLGAGLLGALGMGGAAGVGKLTNIGGAGVKAGGGLLGGASGGTLALLGLGGLGVGTMIGNAGGRGAGVLGGAASGAALGTLVPGIGNIAGAVIGGLAGAIGGLFGGTAREKAKEAERRAIEEAKRAYSADDGMGTGVYLAPAGFNVNGYRFNAGRPSGTVISGNVFNMTLPAGTSMDMARAMLRDFEALSRAQGLRGGTLPRVQ